MLTRILLAALLAGVLSGVFVTAAQELRVTPLIIEAETYENAGVTPDTGIERTFFTLITNVLVGVSFALILTAGVLLTKSTLDLRSGLAWGVGGFIAFVLAPNFGLSPELPGMAAAELPSRQGWWIFTVMATAAALLIFAFKQKIFWMLGGLALLLAPHIYGAPVLATAQSVVPASLAAQFVVATIVTSLLFWLVLGGALGWLVERVTKNQTVEEKI